MIFPNDATTRITGTITFNFDGRKIEMSFPVPGVTPAEFQEICRGVEALRPMTYGPLQKEQKTVADIIVADLQVPGSDSTELWQRARSPLSSIANGCGSFADDEIAKKIDPAAVPFGED